MKHTALLIAAAVALAVPGAAAAQPGGPGVAPHAAFARQRGVPHGMRPERKGRHRGGDQFGGVGLPFAVPLSGPEIVTHDFVDPRDFIAPPYPPRRIPRSVTILEETPVVFREQPHIIELGRRKHRPPIFVVRRGVISKE